MRRGVGALVVCLSVGAVITAGVLLFVLLSH